MIAVLTPASACNGIHTERCSGHSLRPIALDVAYRAWNVPGSVHVHIPRSCLGIEPGVDLPRYRLVAISRTGCRLHGGPTPRSAESGRHTCGSVGRANMPAQPGSVLRRRDPAHAPSLAAPASLR